MTLLRQNKLHWPYTINAQSPQARGLILWHAGSPSGSDRVFDLSGKGQHATINGTIPSGGIWVPGQNDANKSAIIFDGSTNYLKTAVNLSSYQTITLSFWLWWNTFASDDKLAMEYTSNYNSSPGFIIDVNDSGTSKFRFTISDGVGGYNSSEMAWPSANVWNHIAVIFDKTQPAATQVVPYLNGVAVSFTKSFNAAISTAYANDNLYTFSRTGASLFGAGKIEDFRIYKRSLAAAEIQSIFRPSTRWSLGYQKKQDFRSFSTSSVVVDNSFPQWNLRPWFYDDIIEEVLY